MIYAMQRIRLDAFHGLFDLIICEEIVLHTDSV